MARTDTMDCFFISPMGERDSDTRRSSDTLLRVFIRPRLEPLGYKVRRADHISDIGSINDQMIDQLVEADLAVCDLTSLNANVMYELGVRHTIGKPVVVIASSDTELPFDAATFRTIFYDLQNAEMMYDAGEQLDAAVKLLLEGRGGSNPVADRIGRRQLESSSGVVEEALARIERMVYETSRLIETRDEDMRTARFALSNGNYDEALGLFQGVLDREPDNRDAYIGLGRTHRRIGDFDQALATIEELLTREPRYPKALYNHSCYCALAGRPVEQVLRSLRRAIESGDRYRKFASTDPDFDAIRDDPAFVACLKSASSTERPSPTTG